MRPAPPGFALPGLPRPLSPTPNAAGAASAGRGRHALDRARPPPTAAEPDPVTDWVARALNFRRGELPLALLGTVASPSRRLSWAAIQDKRS